MKKVLIVLFIIVSTAGVSAQGLDFGVKAGVNFSSITDASGLNNRTGFVAGIFLGGKLGDKLGIQADLLYSQQGAEFELGNFNLDYVNVPIVLKYFLTDNFNFQLGPQFGVLINDDAQTVVGETINDIAANNFDISAVLGIGFDLPMGIRLDGRYNLGLNDVSKDSNGKNSVITLSVGYSFL
jgi:Outer membrane protein beta-barrel domain